MPNTPDRLPMHTPSLADENFAALARLFPNAVTEKIVGYHKDRDGNDDTTRPILKPAIDFDVLRQEISAEVVEGREERYQFTWPDKRKSVLLANAPIAAALRPCREESVNFDTTENLYIEGDNLDVLKLLRETYLNRVKMIYIDPPYNTGNDFVYEDDFAEEAGEFLRRDRQYDELGNRMERNLDSNGRFHTDWLNMMYPRLRVARDLLKDDGVIFISIDANEVQNLRKLCDEVFGEENFVDMISWFKKASPSNDAQYFSNDIEYIMVYAKSKISWSPNRLPLTDKQMRYYQNPDNDPRGPWNSATYTCNKTRGERPNLYYPITNPNTGREVWPKETAVWAYSQEQCAEHIRDNLLFWGVDGNAQYPRFKKLLTDHQGVVNRTLWHYDDVNHTQGASEELKKLRIVGFSTPKPTRLIKKMIQIAADEDSIILDFFSGSATTAHAVMQLNAEDGGHRKFILVQLPEVTDETSEAYKAGYRNICEIGKERIRRAGRKIVEESPMDRAGLDIGFRVLKLDSSNMKDVYYTPEAYAQMQFNIDGFADNIKPDRTEEDLLFQVLLDLGIPLSAKIERDGSLFRVDGSYLVACFGRVDTDLLTQVAKEKPYYAVFRDSSFADDAAMTNFEQVFATYSPSTIRKVL